MALKDIVIASVSRDTESMNFARKSASFISQKYGIHLPVLERSLYPGKFSGNEYNPNISSDLSKSEFDALKGKNVYLFGVPTNPVDFKHDVKPCAMKSRVEFSATLAKEELNANSVTFVAPNLYFGRADKSGNEIVDEEKKANFRGKANLARAQARAFKANFVNKVITLHAHSPLVSESYKQVFGHPNAFVDVSPTPLLIYYLLNHSRVDLSDTGQDLVLLAPDKGSHNFVEEVYNALHSLGYVNLSMISCDKTRRKPNDPNKVEISNPQVSDNYEGLEGKTVLNLDDMDDTGGTRFASFNTLLEDGIKINGGHAERPKDLVGYSTHAVLAGSEYESSMRRLTASAPKEMIFTNTHPFIERSMTYNMRLVTSVIRTAWYFAEVIAHIEQNKPIESIYMTDNKLDMNKVSGFFASPFRHSEHPLYVDKHIVKGNQ